MRTGSFLKGIALLLAAGPGLAQAENAHRWSDALTKQAVASGFQAKLPPNVSLVLGLATKSESIPVRQLVSRAGQTIHTFNVLVGNKGDIVVFVVDEKKQSTVAYLLDARARLRGAVSYQIGGQPHELAESEARPGLTREIRYWSDYAGGGRAATESKPVEVPKPAAAPKPPKPPDSPDPPKPADPLKPQSGATSPWHLKA